jgi:hypothetical protein
LKADKNHLKGNFNLGVFLWQSPRRDFRGAAAQFTKVITLTRTDLHQQEIYQSAQNQLVLVKKDAAAAGVTLPSASVPSTATGGTR